MIVKKKKCVSCGGEFEPRNIGNTTIRTKRCLTCIGIKNLSKIKKDKVKKKKDLLLTLSDHMKLTKGVVHKYIRERDKNKGCISCGTSLLNRKFDAGHYVSSNSSSFLRFNEFNINSQCVKCNQHLASNAINYRIGLIEKIGLDKVEWLELNRNKEKRWTIFELERIREEFKQKINELKQK